MTETYSTENEDGGEPIVAMKEPLTRAKLRRIEKHVYDISQTHLSEYSDNTGLYPARRWGVV